MAALTCVVQSLKFLRRKPSVLFPFPVTFSVCLAFSPCYILIYMF